MSEHKPRKQELCRAKLNIKLKLMRKKVSTSFSPLKKFNFMELEDANITLWFHLTYYIAKESVDAL